MARLGDVCTIVSGSTPKSNTPEYWGGDIKWITPAELNDDIYIINDSVRHITKLGVTKTGLKSFPKGTVILSSRAPIGKTAIAGCEMYCNQGFKNLICSNKISPQYLYWFLTCNTEYLNSLGRGATFKELSKEIVANIEISLPAIEQQLAIAEKFEKISELITLRKQQLSKFDELVKARFVEMFGSEENKGYLLDLCEFINGDRGKNYPSRSDVVSSGVPFINAGHLEQNRISFDNMNYLTEDKYKSLNSGKIQKNDILYCLRGSLGKKALVDIDKGAIASSLVILRPDTEKIIPSFLLYSLEQPYIIEQMNKANNGSSQPNLSAQSVKAYEIILPPIEQQIEFDTFIQQLDKSKFEIQQSLEKLETLKKSLMQQYFG